MSIYGKRIAIIRCQNGIILTKRFKKSNDLNVKCTNRRSVEILLVVWMTFFFLVAWLVIATLPAQRRSGELDWLTQIEESRTQGGEKVPNKIVSIIASGACSQGTHIFNQNGKKDKRWHTENVLLSYWWFHSYWFWLAVSFLTQSTRILEKLKQIAFIWWMTMVIQ